MRAMNLESASSLLAMGYESLKNADLGTASRFFDDALHADFENPEVLFAMKCARFWEERLAEIAPIESPLERGDRLVAKWKNFQEFLSRIPGDFEMAKYAFKRMAFSAALDFYLALPDSDKTTLGSEFEFKAGRCRKALGDYESAQQHLERAVKFRKDDARFLAELADCHSLAGETRLAKLLFREAFFLGPEKIELDYIESDDIRGLCAKLAGLGYKGGEVAEWLPVYAELEGLFDVKRSLTASEVARLHSSLYQLESEDANLGGVRKPRLLNGYFRMADHLSASGADEVKLERLRLKIRQLDEDIFRQYES